MIKASGDLRTISRIDGKVTRTMEPFPYGDKPASAIKP